MPVVGRGRGRRRRALRRPERYVVYKGPFRELADDAGRVFPRGEPVAVPPSVWEELRRGPATAQFAFPAPAASSAGVTGPAASNGGCR